MSGRLAAISGVEAGTADGVFPQRHVASTLLRLGQRHTCPPVIAAKGVLNCCARFNYVGFDDCGIKECFCKVHFGSMSYCVQKQQPTRSSAGFWGCSHFVLAVILSAGIAKAWRPGLYQAAEQLRNRVSNHLRRCRLRPGCSRN